MRRYLVFVMVLAVVATALAILGPPRSRGRSGASPASAAAPAQDLTLIVRGGTIEPTLVAVPKGTRVRVRIENRQVHIARVALSGYEDRLPVPALAGGAEWSGEFLADRPGEDFAWVLEGRPVARLAVTGSHLEEGHR